MTTRWKKLPVALTIAGSDSGGGAGIQADLKTFAALGVHGTSAIACLTAQNPKRVIGVGTCPPNFLRRQIEAVFEELPPAAVKTGMLGSEENIGVVADFFENQKCPLVVDPVMVATSGKRLLKKAAEKTLVERLLPMAALITPNLDEAGVLIGREIECLEDMRRAARELHRRYGCAVLLKGGHLHHSLAALDIFFDGKTEMEVAALRIGGVRTHGTGCTYSAAICAALAQGHALPKAVQIGKKFITNAIANSCKIGEHFVLNWNLTQRAQRAQR